MKRVIEEGTWFAVPLRNGGFGVGVVGRSSPSGGIILAYFFEKAWARPPSLAEVAGLRPEDAVRVARVGDLGFVDGTWTILGRDPTWRRDEWKSPLFVRKDELSGRAWAVHYSDDDPSAVVSETSTSFDTDLERNAVWGSGAAEIILTQVCKRD